MAASENPLVWDFYRQIGSNAGVKTGGVVHYYDEEAQDIFLNSGLKTRLSTPTEGHWETSELSSPSQFINKKHISGWYWIIRLTGLCTERHSKIPS